MPARRWSSLTWSRRRPCSWIEHQTPKTPSWTPAQPAQNILTKKNLFFSDQQKDAFYSVISLSLSHCCKLLTHFPSFLPVLHHSDSRKDVFYFSNAHTQTHLHNVRCFPAFDRFSPPPLHQQQHSTTSSYSSTTAANKEILFWPDLSCFRFLLIKISFRKNTQRTSSAALSLICTRINTRIKWGMRGWG